MTGPAPGLRPPPCPRTRPSGTAPSANSACPREIVDSETSAGRHDRDPAVAQDLGLGGRIREPLSLVQVRRQDRELRIQDAQGLVRYSHAIPSAMRCNEVVSKPAVVH